MVTVVGPASARTPADLGQLARGFESLGLGLLAVSAWSMQRTVFVNALLPCRPAHTRTRRLAEPPRAGGLATGTDVVPLAGVVRECSLLPAAPDAPGPIEPGLPQRYAVVLASRTTVRQVPDGDHEHVVPYWVTWDVPAPADVDDLTFRLAAAFVAEGREAAVTFLRARRTPEDRLRGRVKVAVSVPRPWGTAEFGALAHRVQARAYDTIGDGVRRPGGVAVQVAWGERWLGSPP